MNVEKVKIQFEASATGLQDVYKQIKQIKDAPNISLDDKLLGQLKDLENKVPALVKKIQDTLAGSFTLGDIQVLDSEFKQLMRLYESTITNLGKANLPAAIQEQITKATDTVKKAQNELDQINKTIRGKQKKLDSSSISGLDKGETAKIDKDFTSQFELKDQKFGSFEQYVQAYEKLAAAMQLTDEEQVQFLQTSMQVQDAYRARAAAIQQEIDVEKAKIPAIQKAISDGERYIQTLKEQAMFNENLSEEEKQVAAAILNASQAITQAKAAERNAIRAATEKVKEDTKEKQDNTKAQEKNTGTVAKAAKQVFTYGTVLSTFRKIYSTVTNTIKEMDKALTGMAIVTNMSREQTWELVGSLQTLANETGKTTTEIADMTTKFLQQGKSISQAIDLTRAAAKAATIAGIDGAQSIDLLTNAMNGFQVSANKAMEVSDKFAALAASAATDYEELATALSKVAAQANLAGMSMDFTLGLLTKGIEVTREAPETIGTALKTVIARMRELTDYGATLEDGIDVNRVAKALDNIGVSLMDTNGQFRDLELVLTEVGQKWDTLNKNQQANVAVALAGTRQQSRLIAMMQDFDRTLELVDISASSYGATLAQSEKYMGGLEAASAKLKTAMEGVVTSIVKSDTIVNIMNMLTGVLGFVDKIVSQTWVMVPLLTVLGVLGANILANKTKEFFFNMEQARLAREQAAVEQELNEKGMAHYTEEELAIKKLQFEEQKRTVAALERQLIDVKARKANAKNLKDQKKLTKEIKKQNILADKSLTEAQKKSKINKLNREYKKEEAALDKEIGELQQEETKVQQELVQEEQQLKTIGEEYKTMLGEQSAYLTASNEALKTQNENAGLLGKVFGGLLATLQAVMAIMYVLPVLQKAYNVLLGEEGILRDKNKRKAIQQMFVDKMRSIFQAAGAAFQAGFPVGLILGAAILAIAGVALAVGAAVNAANGNAAKDSIAQTREELNQLQADLYNLRSAQQNVAKLGDEFESLSNKIVKSNEDLERMNEIAQQINDEAGREVVTLGADAETQAKQIRAYNLQQKAQVRLKTEQIDDKLGEGLTDARNAAWWGGVNAQNAAEDKYYETLKTDSAFVNSLRTVGISKLDGMDEVSATTSDTILDIMVDNIDSKEYFSEEGLDTDAFQQYITDALSSSGFDGGYSALVAQLDAVAEDGSMTAYADMLDRLGTSSDANFKKLVGSLKKSNPMFAAVADMGTETARKFDDIGFSSDELNVMWDKLKKSSKALGKGAGKTFAEMAKNIEAIGDTNGDGVISDLESRQAMYKQLVAEQLKAAEASQAIIDGTDTESDAAKKYHENLDALAKKQKEIEEKQEEINAENDEKNADEKDLEKLEAEMDSLTADAAKFEEEINAVEDAAADCYVNIEELKTILGIISAKEITEEFTKLASAMERVAEISDITSMSLEDQMELLSDYPALLAAMERGYLTAAEAAGLYGETIAKSQEDIADSKSNYKMVYTAEGGAKLDIAQMTGFEKLFDDSEDGVKARKKFLDMGTLSMNDEWVRQYWEANKNTEGFAFKTQNEFIQYLENIKADVKEFNNLSYLEDQLNEGNYAVVMSENAKELWAAATDLKQQRRNALESINNDLEYVDADSDEYLSLIETRNNLLVETLADGAQKLADIRRETDEILRVKETDEKFGWLSAYTGNDDSLSEFIKYENGVAKLNYEMLNSLELTDEQRKEFESYMSTVIEQLGDAAEREKEINDQIREDQEALAQSIIDSEAKILEAQIEALEKRQEAYEKYFDEVDAMEEEQERSATMQDISSQLSALAGGSDSATNALRKELMSQMDDLRKEEKDARKEAAREELIGNIEAQTEEVNAKLDKVNDSINGVIQAIMATAAEDIKVITNEDGSVKLYLGDKEFKPYATGGLVDYTGAAIVHGSPNAPEAFLSAQDTKNMQLLFAVLNDVVAKSSSINADTTNGANNITIDNINIQTNELNNNQDFRTAGQIFAEEFGKAIKQRGLNINVRK